MALWAAAVAGLGAPAAGAATGVRAAGSARVEDAVALVAAASGLAVAWWLAVAALASAAAAMLTGRSGPTAWAVSAVARRTAPAAVRRAVALALGLSGHDAEAASGPDPAWGTTGMPGPRPRARHSARSEVVVLRGDTLWTIVARHLGPGAAPARVATEWPRWYSANADVIGPDPDVLRPGQRLRPPQVPTARDRTRPPSRPTASTGRGPTGGDPTPRSPR